MVKVLAPMSGNIWKILVSEGTQVKEDDELLIMEAMKMEIPVTAPKSGLLVSLKVKEGEPVEADALLAEIK
ncbi:MAG: acetyl-CoA carboxylase biotin carboxyl carrier protein subunit [Deltaproteobacteria bacterium]|jgi:biotin carboxyl carrier protein|nr:acetyl-CoA carboxylase biotin carboxyl carrier protein subunit [Deltaproteobacteria bacterium]